mmetsp:Transcript_58452/g.187726  ORF Transcript_58452/g.187726 Transcript_58452/m.187726 type:complete len:343 (-) Transcript_58452:99-1127(-)
MLQEPALHAASAVSSDTSSDGSSDHSETPPSARAVRVEDQLAFNEGFERKKTAALLFTGSVMGFLGFLFAFVIGFIKFTNPFISEFHQWFPSGFGYFPATVSEMVHDPGRPAGKCFAAFETIGAAFIFLSWYPWRLRNVYIGDDAAVCLLPGGALSWTMFRQFVPPLGMMLVAGVSTTPIAQASSLDMICLAIHLGGAVMLFAGYSLVEAISLGWGPFPIPAVSERTMSRLELRVRKTVLTGIFLCYGSFCAFQGVLLLLPFFPGTHNEDVWEMYNATDEFGLTYGKMRLVDTASGWMLVLKVACYVSEVMCGLLLIASHLVIWGFCSERHVNLRDELWKVA